MAKAIARYWRKYSLLFLKKCCKMFTKTDEAATTMVTIEAVSLTRESE